MSEPCFFSVFRVVPIPSRNRDKDKYLPPVSNIHWISSILYPDLRWIGGHRTVAIQPDLTISDNEANLQKAATSNRTHNHPTTQILFGSIHEHWSWALCQILSLITIIIRVATTFENEKYSTIGQNSGARICTLREAPFWNVFMGTAHKAGGKGLPGWFGALFSTLPVWQRGGV